MGKRGHKIMLSVLRGLRSPMAKRVVKWGLEQIAPHYGELILSGTERLSQFGLGSIAEKITDEALKAVEHAPNSFDKLVEFAQREAGDPRIKAADKREKKAMKVARAGYAVDQKTFDDSQPYNNEPNATYPNPNVAYSAAALFPANQRGMGAGSGVMVYGNDYPFQPIQHDRPNIRGGGRSGGRTVAEQRAGAKPHVVELIPDMTGRNTFGYLGYPGVAAELPNPEYSVAGPVFRKVGRGTNVQNVMPAYGIDKPPHGDLPPEPPVMERKRRTRKKAVEAKPAPEKAPKKRKKAKSPL